MGRPVKLPTTMRQKLIFTFGSRQRPWCQGTLCDPLPPRLAVISDEAETLSRVLFTLCLLYKAQGILGSKPYLLAT